MTYGQTLGNKLHQNLNRNAKKSFFKLEDTFELERVEIMIMEYDSLKYMC